MKCRCIKISFNSLINEEQVRWQGLYKREFKEWILPRSVSQRPAEMNLVVYTELFNVLKVANHNL